MGREVPNPGANFPAGAYNHRPATNRRGGREGARTPTLALAAVGVSASGLQTPDGSRIASLLADFAGLCRTLQDVVGLCWTLHDFSVRRVRDP